MRADLPTIRAALLWTVGLLLSGCPDGSAAPAAPGQQCAQLGDRCRLPDGPMGVCNDTGRRDCASPPCLACMPQH